MIACFYFLIIVSIAIFNLCFALVFSKFFVTKFVMSLAQTSRLVCVARLPGTTVTCIRKHQTRRLCKIAVLESMFYWKFVGVLVKLQKTLLENWTCSCQILVHFPYQVTLTRSGKSLD